MKGRVVTWYISDEFRTTEQVLVDMGLEKVIPRNAHQTALKKAVDHVKKRVWDEVEGLPKSEKVRRAKFLDGAGKLGYVLVVPYLNDSNEYATKNALSVKVDKRTGALEFKQGSVQYSEFEVLRDEIKASYRVEKDTVDAAQFRDVVTRLVRRCNAISLRTTGGFYFVDDRFSERFEKVKELFDNFAEIKLISMPVYDDEETLQSIEYSASRNFESEIASFQDALQKDINNTVTSKRFKGRMSEFARIMERVQEHKDNLREQYQDAQTRTDKMITMMTEKFNEAAGNVIQVFDVAEALEKIGKEETENDDVKLARELSRKLKEEE